jgi:hypothetical protein
MPEETGRFGMICFIRMKIFIREMPVEAGQSCRLLKA